jgi:hypothetical protein
MALLTPETIRATRQWFADNAHACITEAQSGAVRVNDLTAYIAWREESAAAALRGDYDHSLTFRQRATYLQTGECPALLP